MPPHVDILLFGGAFDPPHVGHTTVVREVLHAGFADQVELVPVGQHPFDKSMSAAEHRRNMTELAFAPLMETNPERVKINTFELDSTKISYSYHTVQATAKKNPGKSIGFLIGSDNLLHFDKWKFGPELLQLASILVYPRPGFAKEMLSEYIQPNMFWLDEVSLVVCSSTQVRELISTEQPVPTNWLEPTVLAYIQEHLLVQYQNHQQKNKLAGDT
jgi:nicotinate-nucleotide adenylyltransferase